MKFIVTVGLVALGMFIGIGEAADSKKEEPTAAKLIGVYEITQGEKSGEKIELDRLQDITVRIAENAITTVDKDKKEIYAATYKLETNQKPWRVRMTSTITPVDGKGVEAEGLIEMEGDSVKLIYALPGGAAPTEFKTSDKQQMFVLKKIDK